MVAYVKDRVCETSTTTGTGNITLAGAVAGYQTFSNSGATAGYDFYYLIEAVDGNGSPTGDWETGVGKCPTSTTLQRVMVLNSSNAGALVNLAAGTKRVHLTAPAYQLQWSGCSAHMSANATAQDLTTSTAVTWGGTNPDTDVSLPSGTGFWAVGNPTRLTIPAAGYDWLWIDMKAQVSLQNITVADYVELRLRVNGVSGTVIGRNTQYVSTTTPCIQVASPQPWQMGAIDYVELMIKVGADTSVDILSAETYLTLEIKQ